MTGWTRKRFWTLTGVAADGAGWTVTLDGRPLRTPAKAAFTLPARALAEACAAEWEAQEGELQPETMPLTRTANSAIDTVAAQHAEVAARVAAYGETDLLCYRAEAPEGLVQRQAEAWDPLLGWAEQALGARLRPVAGVIHRPQDPGALARLAAATAALDGFELAALHHLVALTGSLVIGHAAARGAFAPETLWALSRVDETWQEEQWGEDEEAAVHAALKRQAFLDAAHFFSLLQGE